MSRPVPLLLPRIGADRSRVQLRTAHVDARPGKVGDPTGVVGIEVRQHDVANVLAPESEPLHLARGGLRRIQLRPCQAEEGLAQPRRGGGDVVEAEAGVHEDETGRSLEEEDVADQPGAAEIARASVDELAARRTQGSAVEVVDPHRLSRGPSAPRAREDRPWSRRVQPPPGRAQPYEKGRPRRTGPTLRPMADGL